MPDPSGVTTTQNFTKPAYSLADVTADGEAAKALGATYKIIDNGDSFTLEITWPGDPSAAVPTPAPAPAPPPPPVLATSAKVADAQPAAPPPPMPAPVGGSNPALDFARLIVEYWEQCRLAAYHGAEDRPGVWTIGWGCTTIDGRPVTPATPAITQAKADSMLDAILLNIQAGVRQLVKVPITEYQEAALISFAYNEGVPALAGSALLTLLNARHVTEAAAQFPRWVVANGVRVNGLIRRRGAEQAVFLGKVPFGPGLDAALTRYADAALAANIA
jgi:lysozyme